MKKFQIQIKMLCTWVTIFIFFLILVILVCLYVYHIVNYRKHPLIPYAKSSGYKNDRYPYTYKETMTMLEKNIEKPIDKQEKIAVVCLSIGEREFAKINRQRLQQYCDKHGYDLVYYTEIIDDNYEIMWQKCLAVDKTLNMKYENGDYIYDIVMWYDDDIYVTNLNYRIEDFCALTTKDIIMTHDVIKNNVNHYINTGQYILRNCEISRLFLFDTLNSYDLFDGYFHKGKYHEQSIMTYLYFVKYYPYIDVLPYGVLHTFYIEHHRWKFFTDLFCPTYRHWQEGDHCIHFAGIASNTRNRLVNNIHNENLLVSQTPKNWK